MRQCNQLDAMIVPSNAMLTVLRQYGVETPIEIIPTGLDMDKFKQGDGNRFRDQHGIPHNRPTLVHVGRVAFEKNIDFLLHVLNEIKKSIPDILMIIAGEGPAKPHLQKLVHSLHLQDQVMFVGYLSRSDALLDCYKAGDVFVFSSRTETQGLVLLEAMALGVPVVSIAAMGTVDILSPQQGCIVADENVADFTKKTLSVLKSPALHSELSLEAKKYAGTWSNSTMTQRVIDFYGRCVQAVELSRNATPVYAAEKSN
jgi:glycosyltransferase involved in cell wall biosynthesis